jgi:hypothetical protein
VEIGPTKAVTVVFPSCGRPDLENAPSSYYFLANVQSFRKQLAQEETASKAVKGLW